MEDALAFGGACISLLNHADRVKVGCLAQLVNAIAPIMTEPGGAAWRQTIFHPFAHFSAFGRGQVLRAEVEASTYAASYFDPRGPHDLYFALPEVPHLKLAAVHDEPGGWLTLFALNRDLSEELELEVVADGFAKSAIAGALQLCDRDLKVFNTKSEPERVRPTALGNVRIERGGLRATLLPASWNVVRVKSS